MGVILYFLIFGPFLGAAVIACLGEKRERARVVFADLFLVLEFGLAVYLTARNVGGLAAGGTIRAYVRDLCGFGLSFQLDGFRGLYGIITAFMWLAATVFSRAYFQGHSNKMRFYAFMLLTLGATMGVFFSQDLFTLFLFFEIMSFTSCVWVAQEESREALRAAGTYLAVAVIGGMVLLMGLFLLYHELGTLDFDGIRTAAQVSRNQEILFAAGLCMLVGFGAKAGAFPLHIWLPKAHPVAPAPASALLSGILTKTGIFGILVISVRLFSGNGTWGRILLMIGVLTMFLGALLAVFSIDLKRTLACSSMSQIGFILVGAGMMTLLGEGNGVAARGVFLHMANHSLIKLLLFLAAGAIFQNTHGLDLNRIRGFGRKKPLLKILFLIGGLAISGIPLFGGYVSKTLLHESILAYGSAPWIRGAEIVFLLSGGLTLAYMTKLFVSIFIEKNADAGLQAIYDRKKKYLSFDNGAALTVSGAALFVWGLFPHGLMERAAGFAQGFLGVSETAGEAAAYFSWESLQGAVVTLAVGAVVYFGGIRVFLYDRKSGYKNCWPRRLDLEELVYRPLVLKGLPLVGGVASRILDSFVDGMAELLRRTLLRDSPLPAERTEGNLLTETAGRLANAFCRLRNRFSGREPEPGRDYVHVFAMKHMELREDGDIISRSLSFGLMLFGIGLCATLIYILL